MKNLLTLILCVFTLGICSSCTKNDAVVEEISSEVSIVGKWKCVSANYGEWVDEFFVGDLMEVGDMMYINDNNTIEVKGKKVNSKGEWHLNDTKLVVKINTAVVPWTYTITELTKSKLTFYTDYLDVYHTFERQ